MYIKTVKMRSVLKTAVTVLIAAAVVFAAVYAVNRLIKPPATVLETESERLGFLKSLGWETSEEAINCREVLIPEEWNEVYEKYNELQKQQGFDLEKYRGRTAEIYTYTVLNYEGRPDNMVANLVLCDGRLIAADISCTELGGFMQGIAGPGEMTQNEG